MKNSNDDEKVKWKYRSHLKTNIIIKSRYKNTEISTFGCTKDGIHKINTNLQERRAEESDEGKEGRGGGMREEGEKGG